MGLSGHFEGLTHYHVDFQGWPFMPEGERVAPLKSFPNTWIIFSILFILRQIYIVVSILLI